MPRNGSGVYSKPSGSTATTGSTALASQHNTPIDDLVTDANTARPIVAGGTGATTRAGARQGLYADNNYIAKAAGYTPLATDRSKVIRCTAALTLDLTAAATLADGWFIDVIADGGAVTIDPNGSETIDGATTITISDGSQARIVCTGTTFYSMFDQPAVPASIANVVEDTTPQLGGTLDANSKAVFLAKGADVASAAELLVLTDGNSFDVTGTATITSIETTADAFGIGSAIQLQFDGVLTLTHHATDLILPGGANITTAAGDIAVFRKYAAGDWRCESYSKASGLPVTVQGFGIGQTYVNVTSSRSSGVSYQNTSGGTMWVACYVSAGSQQAVEVSADEVTWIRIGSVGGGGNNSAYFPVIDQYYYKVNAGTVSWWTELS